MHRRPERCNTPSSAKSTTRKRSSPAKVLLGFHESYGYKVPDASGSEATHRGVAKNERKGLRREAGKASSAATARRHRRYPVPERSFRVWLPKFSRSKISGFCENTSARQVFFIFGWTLNASFRSFAKNSLLHSVFSYLIIRKSKCSTDFKRNDFLKKNEAYPLGALRSLKFAYRKLRISLFVELAV